MLKSIFRILAFKCLQPEYPTNMQMHHVRHMQRSLYGINKWYTFYRKVFIDRDGASVKLSNDFFDDKIIYDTPSMSVSVSAIVGENGSGKSSILDMIIRILNNTAAAVLGEKPQYAAAEHIHYIENVYGSILFIQGEELKRLNVEGRNIKLIKYQRDNTNKESITYNIKENYLLLSAPSKNPEPLLKRNTKDLAKLAELFYTVVSNYSIYAYNPNDYWEENTDETRIGEIRPKQNYKEYPYLLCWLTGLFHKNDGYQMPIVINPMRINGIINAPKENTLAKERLLSMLYYTNNNSSSTMDKYPFRIINKDHIIVGFCLNPWPDQETRWTKDWMVKRELFSKRSQLYTKYDQIRDEITKYLETKGKIEAKNIKKELIYRYLVYKIIKIGINYKRYNKITNNLRRTDWNTNLLYEHIDELIHDHSHITVKLRRSLMFLYTDMYKDGIIFSLKEIESHAKGYIDQSKTDIYYNDLADFLPPPIFDVEFRIIKRENIHENEEYDDENIIPFWSLSSGERQIAYIISNFVYHLVNINSVHNIKDDKIADMPLLKYKYINVIFDEIELYFHPDLQRRFLFLIIQALRNIHLEHIEGINILLVTHSPFILSDLPDNNVLILGENNAVTGKTFCANIHEMLGHNFFMEYSMGKIAQEEVEEIFRKYNQSVNGEKIEISKSDWERYNFVTNIVADEYLQSSIRRVMEKLKKIQDYD